MNYKKEPTKPAPELKQIKKIKSFIDLCLSFEYKLVNCFGIYYQTIIDYFKKKTKYNESFNRTINNINYGNIIYFIENLENFFMEPTLEIKGWFLNIFFDEIAYMKKNYGSYKSELKIPFFNYYNIKETPNNDILFEDVKSYFIKKFQIEDKDLEFRISF